MFCPAASGSVVAAAQRLAGVLDGLESLILVGDHGEGVGVGSMFSLLIKHKMP